MNLILYQYKEHRRYFTDLLFLFIKYLYIFYFILSLYTFWSAYQSHDVYSNLMQILVMLASGKLVNHKMVMLGPGQLLLKSKDKLIDYLVE